MVNDVQLKWKFSGAFWVACLEHKFDNFGDHPLAHQKGPRQSADFLVRSVAYF